MHHLNWQKYSEHRVCLLEFSATSGMFSCHGDDSFVVTSTKMTRILYASSVINFQAHASFYITTAIYSILWENLPIDLNIQMKDVFFWLNKQQNTRKINVIHQIQTSCKSVIVLVIDLQHRPLSSNPIRASKIYLAGCSLEFTIGQFLRVGWQIAIVSRYVLLYPSTLARICGMNLGVQNCFFLIAFWLIACYGKRSTGPRCLISLTFCLHCPPSVSAASCSPSSS